MNSLFFQRPWLLPVLILLGLGVGLDTLQRWQQIQLSQLQTLRQQQAELVTLVAEADFWATQAEQARRLRVTLEQQLWRSPTSGLAQAAVQSWLERLLRQFNLDHLRSQVATPVIIANEFPMWAVDMQIEGPFQPTLFYRLLEQIETNPQLTVVQNWRVERRVPDQPGFVSLRLRAFVLQEGGG